MLVRRWGLPRGGSGLPYYGEGEKPVLKFFLLHRHRDETFLFLTEPTRAHLAEKKFWATGRVTRAYQ